jgi:hypothetical protein
MARNPQRKSPPPQRRAKTARKPSRRTGGGILGPGAVTITGKTAGICWALQLLPIRKLRPGRAGRR